MNKLLAFFLVTVLVAGVAGVAGASCAAPTPTTAPTAPAPTVQTFRWRLQTPWGAGHEGHPALVALCDELYERTNGQLEIAPLTEYDIVAPKEKLDACANGVFEFYATYGAYEAGKVPVANIEAGLPFLFRGGLDEVMDIVYNHGLIDIFREAYADYGNLYYLRTVGFGTYPVILSNAEIRSIDDWKGVKIRQMGAFAKYTESLGASTVFVPGGELYMALMLGTVDAIGITAASIETRKLYEVTDYIINPPHCEQITATLLVNGDAWKALPDNLKDDLMWFGDEYNKRIDEMLGEIWRRAQDPEVAKERGYEVITLPDADVEKMKEMAIPIWDEYAAKDSYSARAIQIIKDYYGVK